MDRIIDIVFSAIGAVLLFLLWVIIVPVFVAVMIFLLCSDVAHAEPSLKEMKFTCYCPESCPGTTTATGEKVRFGICAVDKEHLGYTAVVYTEDMELVGYFECLDTGGQPIQDGYVIDIWTPDIETAKEYMKLTGGKVFVQYVLAEG